MDGHSQMRKSRRPFPSILGILALLILMSLAAGCGGGVVPAGDRETAGREAGDASPDKPRKARTTQSPARKLPDEKTAALGGPAGSADPASPGGAGSNQNAD